MSGSQPTKKKLLQFGISNKYCLLFGTLDWHQSLASPRKIWQQQSNTQNLAAPIQQRVTDSLPFSV